MEEKAGRRVDKHILSEHPRNSNMASASERLSALREKLQEARDENLKAVEDEAVRLQTSKHPYVDEGAQNSNSPRKRKRASTARNPQQKEIDVGSADEADGEDLDERLRSMKRRARLSQRARQERACFEISDDKGASTSNAVTYGGEGGNEEDVENMVEELQRVERRRAKYRRRRTFDEDRTDITFINEGNRIFNRALERHFDKFESVKKLKDSLERGTA